MPYTHPMPVRSFLLTIADGVSYVITGGGEGFIKIWKFDPALSKFDAISTLEGHIRDVTCLLLFGKCWPLLLLLDVISILQVTLYSSFTTKINFIASKWPLRTTLITLYSLEMLLDNPRTCRFALTLTTWHTLNESFALLTMQSRDFFGLDQVIELSGCGR